MLNKKKNLYTLRMTQTCKLCTISVRFCTPMEPIITKPSLVHDFEISGFFLICLHLYFYLLQIALTLINNWRQKGKQMPHKLQKNFKPLWCCSVWHNFLRFMQVQIVLLKWEKGSLWERKCLKKSCRKTKLNEWVTIANQYLSYTVERERKKK